MPHNLTSWMACVFAVVVLVGNGCGGTKGGSSGTGGSTGSGGMAVATGGTSGTGSGTGGSGIGAKQQGPAEAELGRGTGGIGGGPGSGGAGGAAIGGTSGTGRGGTGTGTSTGGTSGSGPGGVSGAGGAGGPSYSGCSFVGGLDRIVVGKRDAGRNLCVVIVFVNGTNTSQIVLPPIWRVSTHSPPRRPPRARSACHRQVRFWLRVRTEQRPGRRELPGPTRPPPSTSLSRFHPAARGC